MKKIIIILFLLLTCGCTKHISEEELKYNELVSELKNNVSYDTELDFDINITIDKLNKEELVYRVYIDNPKVDMNNIEALVIHDKKTNDVFPSSGIFESKLNLKKDRKEKDTKGIILGGYIDFSKDINEFSATFKVLVKYKIDNKEKIIYYKQQFMTE